MAIFQGNSDEVSDEVSDKGSGIEPTENRKMKSPRSIIFPNTFIRFLFGSLPRFTRLCFPQSVVRISNLFAKNLTHET